MQFHIILHLNNLKIKLPQIVTYKPDQSVYSLQKSGCCDTLTKTSVMVLWHRSHKKNWCSQKVHNGVKIDGAINFCEHKEVSNTRIMHNACSLKHQWMIPLCINNRIIHVITIFFNTWVCDYLQYIDILPRQRPFRSALLFPTAERFLKMSATYSQVIRVIAFVW